MAARTEETQSLILAAAQSEFAERGVSAARLEDIADRVGITRAAIIYHFNDKDALYHAALTAAFEGLSERIDAARQLDLPDGERFEAVIEAWFNYAGEQPNLARMFMREVADSPSGFRPEVQQLVAPMFSSLIGIVEEGQRKGVFRSVDPGHLIGILSGATTFFVTSNPLLMAEQGPDAVNAHALASYRSELIAVTRCLLGTDGPRQTDSSEAPETSEPHVAASR